MKFVKSIAAAALVLGTLSAPAMADDAAPAEKSPWGTFTGNVAIANDYVFRGISQTLNSATIQGGLDWDSGMGIYVGTWGSNIDFGAGLDGGMEWDIYGGYRGTIGEAFSYDLGAIGYIYPGSSDTVTSGRKGTPTATYNYWEGKAVLGYNFGFATLTASVYYSPNFTGDLGSAVYYSGGISVPFDKLTISGSVGRQTFSDVKGINVTDFNIGASYAFPWFTLDVRWSDTDAQAGNAFYTVTNAKGPHTLNDSRVVAKISRAF